MGSLPTRNCLKDATENKSTEQDVDSFDGHISVNINVNLTSYVRTLQF